MHVYLLGYRGSGKSTVGRLLAQALDRPFVDTDDWIESGQGQSIREIFAAQGESGFRDLEHAAIAQVSSFVEPAVVALGGGAILRSDNQQLIRQTGHRVWLAASAEYLYDRICADSNSEERRPNLTDRGGFDEVAEILAIRRPIYSDLANLTINTMGKSPDQVAREIYQWLESHEASH
jgi:shikimate kinase